MRQARNHVGESVFSLLLDLEVQKAIRLQYPVSVVCFTPNLPTDDAGASRTWQIAQTSVRALRATDVTTVISADTTECVAVLLIGAEARSLPRIFSRVTGLQALAEGAERGGPSWSAGGACYPQTVVNGSDLLPQAIDLMTQAKREGGSCFYLPS